MSGTTYETDVSMWAVEQAGYLRAGSWSQLDVVHLADEIEALARTDRHAVTSALRLILLNILKWDHQPERRTRSWATSIRTQRLAVLEHLEDSPSLARHIPLLLVRAYHRARIEAADETGLDETVFPPECPYPYDTIMTRAIVWPAETRTA